MKLEADGFHGPTVVINILKKTIMVFLFIHMQSCVMDKSDLKINIINLSKNKIYVGGLYDCDSCEIQRDVRFHCTYSKNDPPMIRMINAKDSIHLVDKLEANRIKIYVINADSLDSYCNKGSIGNIVNKKWVNVLSGDVNLERKTCTILIR